MINKIEARHLKSIGLAACVGAVASAVTYFKSKPVPVYENGQLVHKAGFMAHDNGWPLPFYHYACFPYPQPSCGQYLDLWALVLNVSCWAVAAGLAWFVFKRIWHHKPKRSRKRKK